MLVVAAATLFVLLTARVSGSDPLQCPSDPELEKKIADMDNLVKEFYNNNGIPDVGEVEFRLFTPKTGNANPEIFTVSTLQCGSYDPDLDCTKILIHGYMDSPDSSTWQKRALDAIINNGLKCNVILLNWNNNGAMESYPEAVEATYSVSVQIARVLLCLQAQCGLSRSSTHLVGHSLGAQISGNAGYLIVNSQIGRITGLDPAGPILRRAPDDLRISKDDGSFVDCLHTNGEEYGTLIRCGHVDIYVDGGAKSANCEKIVEANPNLSSMDRAGRSFMCDHLLVTDLYVYSITGKASSCVAHACADYESFYEGLCNTCGENPGDCVKIGEPAAQEYLHQVGARIDSSLRFYVCTTPDGGDDIICDPEGTNKTCSPPEVVAADPDKAITLFD